MSDVPIIRFDYIHIYTYISKLFASWHEFEVSIFIEIEGKRAQARYTSTVRFLSSRRFVAERVFSAVDVWSVSIYNGASIIPAARVFEKKEVFTSFVFLFLVLVFAVRITIEIRYPRAFYCVEGWKIRRRRDSSCHSNPSRAKEFYLLCNLGADAVLVGKRSTNYTVKHY